MKSGSATDAWTASTIASIPLKAVAKRMPVSARSSSGSAQPVYEEILIKNQLLYIAISADTDERTLRHYAEKVRDGILTYKPEAQEVADRIGRVSRRFLGRAPRPIGWIPDDPLVQACVNRRGAVAALEPASPAARALARLAESVHAELLRHEAVGAGRRLVESLGRAAKSS